MTEKLIDFTGSRNYCSEQVYDLIWELPPGKLLTIEILDKDRVHVYE